MGQREACGLISAEKGEDCNKNKDADGAKSHKGNTEKDSEADGESNDGVPTNSDEGAQNDEADGKRDFFDRFR